MVSRAFLMENQSMTATYCQRKNELFCLTRLIFIHSQMFCDSLFRCLQQICKGPFCEQKALIYYTKALIYYTAVIHFNRAIK